MAAIAEGDRIVLIDRRLFKDDNTRIFVGLVETTEGSLVRARGLAGAQRRRLRSRPHEPGRRKPFHPRNRGDPAPRHSPQ